MTSLSLSPSKQVISLPYLFLCLYEEAYPWSFSRTLRIKNREKKRRSKQVHSLKLLKYLIRGTKYLLAIIEFFLVPSYNCKSISLKYFRIFSQLASSFSPKINLIHTK